MNFKLMTKLFASIIWLICLSVAAYSTVAVKVYSYEEAMGTSNISKPRLYITNTGTETISNVTYNYYFQTENSNTPVLEDYYTPNETITLVSDGGSYYHVKYVLTGSFAAGQTLPNVSGNSIGLHYNTWGIVDKTNDYSNNLRSTFYENQNITVYVNGTKIYGTEPSYSGGGSGSSSELSNSIELQNFALYSLNGTYVRDRSKFFGGGAVGSNTFVEINSGAVVYGNLVCGGNVTLHSSAVINGDILARGIVTRAAGDTVRGTVTQNASVGTLTIPILTVTAGTSDKIFNSGTSTLSPGQYRDLTVQSGATLHLLPGIYKFNNFTIQNDAHVLFDVAMNQNLEIMIAGDFALNDRATMQFSSVGYAPSVKIYTNDQNTMNIRSDSKIAGLVYAPYASVSMYSRAQCNGAIYAKQITVEPDAIVSSELVDIDGDADGDLLPNYLEVLTGTDPLDSMDFHFMAIPHPLIFQTMTCTVDAEYEMPYYSEYEMAGRNGSGESDKIKVNFPVGSVASGKETVLLDISNDPLDYNGNTLAGYSTPAGYSPASRFISLEAGAINVNSTITMTVPLTGSVNLNKRYSALYYSGKTSSWIIADATENVDSNGTLNVTATLLSPVAVIIIEKNSTSTAYLDEGMVFADQALQAELALSLKIKNVPVGTTGTFTIEYVDKAIPSNIVPSYYTGTFVSGSTSSSGIELSVVTPQQEIISSGQIIVKNVAIVTNNGVNYNRTFNKTIEQGQKMLLQSDAKYYYYNMPENNPVSTLYSSSFVLESVDLDDEGRARYNADNTDFVYDFYLKDHLGSTREVINTSGDITEATMYQPYGKMVTLKAAVTADNARRKFTGKELDAGEVPYGEVLFDIAIDDFTAAVIHIGGFFIGYTDLASGKSHVKGYNMLYDATARKYTLNKAERFPDNIRITSVMILAVGTTSMINYQKTCSYTVNTDAGLILSLNVNANALIANPGTDYFVPNSYTPVRVAGSNLFYFLARYYDPEIAYFTSTDPAEGNGYNPYAYCLNDPINAIDPDGENPVAIANAVTTVVRTHGPVIAQETAALARTVGARGEVLVRGAFDIGSKVGVRVGDKLRIPDGINKVEKMVNEVKNVKYQGLTAQLKDYMKIADDMGGKLRLFLRGGADVSKPLQKEIEAGKVILEKIPEATK